MHDETPAVGGADENVPREAYRLLKGGVRASIELVLTGDPLCLLDGRRGQGHGRRRCRIVVVEELGEERPEAQLPTGRGVVRHEDAELLIGNESEIGVEEARVAAVANDVEPVTRFLVEA